jgi:1,3-beta-galactosyl-N-acetylhexosamine phosphorylase
MQRLGADAVCDSDGTQIPPQFAKAGVPIHSKYYVNHGDPAWVQARPDQIQQLYLMSLPVTATSAKLLIKPLDGFFAEQFKINLDHPPAKWWEVRDRTSGTVLEPGQWSVDVAGETVHVLVNGAEPYHQYTVSFLVWVMWDSAQICHYLANYQLNDGDLDQTNSPTNNQAANPQPADAQTSQLTSHQPAIPHDPSMDMMHVAGRKWARQRLAKWLEAHPETTAVNFTTFFFQFPLIYDAGAREKFIDWYGYGGGVSVAGLEAFAAAYGYRLTPEDFVDEGYYHASSRPPNRRWRDWMDFVSGAVTAEARQLVQIVHRSGRRAMMFLGDQWIGTEPHGPDFHSIGLDAVVGPVTDGATLRLLADIRGVKCTEARLAPAFQPAAFSGGSDPARQALTAWVKTRRAMLRRPVDRIGWSGAPSLAAANPRFIEVAERIADEFRELHTRCAGTAPLAAPRRLAVLNEWGALRAWLPYTVAHGRPYRFTEPYAGLAEALAGLPFDVTWLSFEEVARDGIGHDIGAIINAGPAGTAFSGGSAWADPALAVTLREWTHGGGFFLGVGEPSALVREGRTFQLADVLGLDQEVGFSLSTSRYPRYEPGHLVAADLPADFSLPDAARAVYALEQGASVVREAAGDVLVAVNRYGSGRSAYLAGLPYDAVNARLVHRVLAWGMGLAEAPGARSGSAVLDPASAPGSTGPAGAADLPYLPDNPAVDIAVYPKTGWLAAANASFESVVAHFNDPSGDRFTVELGPAAIEWRPLPS